MVKKQANQSQIELLINLVLEASPKIKILALKTIQNLINIQIPASKFEEAITSLTKDKNSLAGQIQYNT